MQNIEPDLRNFLPAELYAEAYVKEWSHEIPTASGEEKKEGGKIEDVVTLRAIFEHLAALQKILSDYTSSLISEKRDERGNLHLNKRNGALMFTDLAGFTKLMEANAPAGQEGAKNLLAVFNNYFTDIIEVIVKSGGDLLEFTGDALLVFFPIVISEEEDKNFANLQKAVAKAVRAGLRMQRKMINYKAIKTPVGEIELQMRIGIHAGHFYSADIGTPRRRDHVLLGKNVQAAKQTESKGMNGRVNLSPEAFAYINKDAQKEIFEVEINPKDEAYRLVVDNAGDKLGDYEIMAKTSARRLASTVLYSKQFSETYDAIAKLLDVIREFASFIPHEMLSLLVESVAKENGARRSIRPEFPAPTVMFVNFIGLPEMIDQKEYDEQSIISVFNETFAKLNAAVEKRGGVLKKVTYHLTGSDIVIYFGVPTMHTNDPLRAASAALEIRNIIQKTPIPALKAGCADPQPQNGQKIYCKIGINTGNTFVAEIGDPRGRREFNVLGDTVNTAARLMSRAHPNQILVSEAVMQDIQEKYACEHTETVQLKGKGAAMPLYEIKGRKK